MQKKWCIHKSDLFMPGNYNRYIPESISSYLIRIVNYEELEFNC